MLLKNEKPFSPSQEDIASFKGEATFKLVNAVANKKRFHRKDEKGTGRGKKDQPRNFTIENRFSYTDPKTQESAVIIYYETKKPRRLGSNTVEEYDPLDTIFESGEVTVNKSDHWWFLAHHPRQASSPYKEAAKGALFYLEDKAGEAALKAIQSRDNKKAIDLLWDIDKGLTANEAAEMLKSFHYPGVDEMDDNQIRVELEKYAKKNPSDFIQKSAGATMAVRAIIQEAVDQKLIKYSDKKKAWFLVGDDGVLRGQIVDVRAREDKYDRIAKFLIEIDKESTLDFLVDKIKEKKEAVPEESPAETEEVQEEPPAEPAQEEEPETASKVNEEPSEKLKKAREDAELQELIAKEAKAKAETAKAEAEEANAKAQKAVAEKTEREASKKEPPVGAPAV